MSDNLYRVFMILAITTITFIDILIVSIIVKIWFCKNKVKQGSKNEPLLFNELTNDSYYVSL